jgi:hypothetical protein
MASNLEGNIYEFTAMLRKWQLLACRFPAG